MLNERQVAELLIKVAVSASIASILMRFASIQKILLREERSVKDRLQLAFIFSILFGASAGVRILSRSQYQAIDLALEGALIAGMLGGYVSGLITGLCVCLPDMVTGKFMSMPLFAAAGILGAVMHDLAPEKNDVWYFSAFLDLNVYRFVRQTLRLSRRAMQRRELERAAFNIVCNVVIVAVVFLRWSIDRLFPVHGTFILFHRMPLNSWTFAASAATTLFCVSLPLRVWSSFRAEKQLDLQHAQLVEAQLAALTNQINPHFLFNTLSSVATLIRIDPDRARGMIYKLSSILRRLLRKTASLTPLREEVSFIDDYLAIEMARFGDNLRFQKEIEEATLDRLVPSMMLQPIIENSIKHGLANKVDGGSIRMRAWLDDARLHISIEDDGVGIEQTKLDDLFQNGIGVSNVHERLRVLFGSSYRMFIESKPGEGTQTHIEIPELDGQRN